MEWAAQIALKALKPQLPAVSFEEKQAAVTFSGENAILQTIIQTITQLGFEVVATTEVN